MVVAIKLRKVVMRDLHALKACPVTTGFFYECQNFNEE